MRVQRRASEKSRVGRSTVEAADARDGGHRAATRVRATRHWAGEPRYDTGLARRDTGRVKLVGPTGGDLGQGERKKKEIDLRLERF